MAVDNTHTKYLKGADKKAWNNYGEALKAQSSLDGLLGGMPKLKPGEEYDVPVKKSNKKKENNK